MEKKKKKQCLEFWSCLNIYADELAKRWEVRQENAEMIQVDLGEAEGF